MNIVLHHGLFGFPTEQVGPFQLEYFKGIKEAIQPPHRVFTTGVNPIGSLAGRALQFRQGLATVFSQIAAADRVVIIAHSMGGLDARKVLAEDPGVAARVAALVTIATPHHGSPLADLVTRLAPPPLGGLHLPGIGAINHVVGALPGVPHLSLDTGAIPDLTTAASTTFNQAFRNRPGIRYFAIAADCTGSVPTYFAATYKIVKDAGGGDNDGVVGVASATPPLDATNPWRMLGTWSGIDHLNAVNMRIPGDPLRPDVAPRYKQVVDQIAPAVGLT